MNKAVNVSTSASISDSLNDLGYSEDDNDYMNRFNTFIEIRRTLYGDCH